jgi:hypothetical protein
MNAEDPMRELDSESWLEHCIASMPTPPQVVVDRLKTAGIKVVYADSVGLMCRQQPSRTCVRKRVLWASATFARLPTMKRILEECGVPRIKWPQPPKYMRRPNAARVYLSLAFTKCGKVWDVEVSTSHAPGW